MSAERESLFSVALSDDDVACLAGVVAQLGTAVHNMKVVELDAERLDRLNQAEHLVGKWQKVVTARKELARAEAEARRGL